MGTAGKVGNVKIARYSGPTSEARVAVIEDGEVFDGGTSIFEARKGERIGALDQVALLPPVAGPRKIVCVGLNYRDHAEEAGLPLPESPVLFAKWDNCIVGPGQAVEIPPFAQEVDYEAELAVVIGTPTSRVSVDDAVDHILGYTCLNDVSARDIQFADGQWVRGKSLDTFCPIGPWIVTPDELTDPQSLAIRCVVNGVTHQDSNTKEMVWSAAELVSFISDSIALAPGDVIATGTPAGVGFKKNPPVLLKPGDVVRVEIDGIGVLENPVVARP